MTAARRTVVLAALGAAGAVVALLGAAAGLGAATPEGHAPLVAARLAHPPTAAFDAIADLPASVAWRSDLEAIERLPDTDGVETWLEHGEWGDLRVEVPEAVRPARYRFVLPPGQPDLPFHGEWLVELQPAGDGTWLTITESGRVPSALFRGLQRLVFGYHASLEAFVRDLAAHLDAGAGRPPAPPEVVRGPVVPLPD